MVIRRRDIRRSPRVGESSGFAITNSHSVPKVGEAVDVIVRGDDGVRRAFPGYLVDLPNGRVGIARPAESALGGIMPSHPRKVY